MPKYDNFEDLPVWQEASRLYNEVLDFLETPNVPVTGTFRNQLERAALSVSNNIAEGFERMSTGELIQYLGIARGSAGEVRSMLKVVSNRPRLKPFARELTRIQARAKSCAKQLSAWTESIEGSPVQGKRYLTREAKEKRDVADKAAAFRLNFLKGLPATHPLYNSSEAKAARGEAV